jgi:hypothetical protein
VPALASQRDSHNITGLSAAPRIAGMPPAPRPDVLRAASGPGTGLGLRRCGAHLTPASVASATAGVWSSAYITCQYGCGIRAEATAGRLPPRPSRWPDSAVDPIRALRMSLQNKPTVSQTALLRLTTSSYPCAVRAPGVERRHPGAPAEVAASPRRDDRCGQAAQNRTICMPSTARQGSCEYAGLKAVQVQLNVVGYGCL